MVPRGPFGSALLTVIVSAGAVLAGLVWELPASAAFAALIPLPLYHAYLHNSRKRPSEAAVDSVYYVGFLITVFELAASALVLSRDDDAVGAVLIRFAIGLIATGYAIVARMHLQSVTEGRAETADTAWQAVAERSSEMIETMDVAIVRLRGFVESASQELRGSAERARNALEQAATDSVRIFADELARTTAGARAGIEEVSGLLSEPALVRSRERFRQQVDAAGTAAASFAQSLETLTGQGNTVIGTFRSAAESSQALTNSAGALRERLDMLAQVQGVLATLTSNIERATAASASAADSTAQAAARIAMLNDASAAAAPLVSNLVNAATNVNVAMTALASSATRLDAAWATATNVTAGTQTLGAALAALNSELPRTHENLIALSSEANSLAGGLRTSGPLLQQDLERSTAAVLRLADGLSRLADLIIERTSQRRGIQ